MEVILQETLQSLALAAVSLLGAYGMYYIQKAAARLKEQTRLLECEEQRALVEAALADAEKLATITVAAIEQTTAGTLRKLISEGKADRADLVKLGKAAALDVKKKLAPTAREVIEKQMGSFDEYINNLIEAKVLALKRG